MPANYSYHRDETNAYWIDPARGPELHVATCSIPATGEIGLFPLYCLTFGTGGSVNGYCKKPTFVTIAAVDLLAVAISPYIDVNTGWQLS